MQKITRKNLRPFLKKYATDVEVLEVGGGRVEGNHSYEDLFPNRITYDIDPKRKPDVVGDAHELPFEDSSFEFVLCTEVLEHLHSPWVAVDEMRRILKPGGKLVLTTRFVYPLHDAPHDYFRFTENGIRRLFRDWDILELTPETKTFSTVAALLQRICFQTKLKGGRFTKASLYLLASILNKSNWLIKEEYGDIKKIEPVNQILSTGIYLCAKKL